MATSSVSKPMSRDLSLSLKKRLHQARLSKIPIPIAAWDAIFTEPAVTGDRVSSRNYNPICPAVL